MCKKLEKRNLIEKTFEFIEQDIEIRIESLKCQIEILGLQLIHSLDKQYSSDKIKKLKPNYLALLLNKNKIHRPLIDITINEIGHLNFEFNSNQLENLKMEFHKIDIKQIKYPMGVCWSGLDTRVSTPYQYAAIDYSNCNQVVKFDKNFNLKNSLKIFSQTVNLDQMRPIRLETNFRNYFYFLDKSTRYVYMVRVRDKNQGELEIFNEIKEICVDICFYDEILYVLSSLTSDSSMCGVKKFSSTGILKTSLTLTNVIFKEVVNLKINKKYICILESYKEIKLYDSLTGLFKFKLDNMGTNCICFADNFLLTLDNNGDLKCFELDSLSINFQSSRSLPKNEPYFMGYFNRKIFISYPWKREFCILK